MTNHLSSNSIKTVEPVQTAGNCSEQSGCINPTSNKVCKIVPRINLNQLTISDSVLNCIGSTPLVRFDRLAKSFGLKCNLLAKLEFYNSGGSVKDRIALRMIEEAERSGKLIPGKSVIIEPTSGNTGIGLALASAVKGYRCIIVLPEKMSREKVNTMKTLGAQIVRTPTEAASTSPESHLSVAARLEKAIPGGIILNQYSNPFNPQTHYDVTGPEIIEAMNNTPHDSNRPSSGIVDLLVAGAGTGGTISGVSGSLKSYYGPDRVKTIGVDPIGSVIAVPETLNASGVHSYKIEGTGYDFKPETLDYAVVDDWMKTGDEEAFEMLRHVIRCEGSLCGGSTGQVICAAMKYLKPDGEGWKDYGSDSTKNVVIICPDSIRNYITKDWLIEGCESLELTEAKLLEEFK
ncbi:tryptophan synthase beta subunit-like PLP-dependent enzyme [Phakopsora pachyrhizi]|nr:tryptophan synthase beta subunit-like PLP-dependent enzyme [Phakopsora pachyrhizi]